MVDTFHQTLNDVGYAKVVVAINPEAMTEDIEQALAGMFIIPNEVMANDLALAAVRHASGQVSEKRMRLRVYPRLGLVTGYVDSEGVKLLMEDQRVRGLGEAPELSLIRPIRKLTSSAPQGITWGIERMGVVSLWNQGLTGAGVIVAHLDTGVDGSHEALQGAIHSFAEFDLQGDIVKNPEVHDSDKHGTHTAATIVGRPTQNGSVGVAPGAKLASALVIEGGNVIDRILSGMEWAIGKEARILSMSLGLRGYSTAFQSIIDALRKNNILPVIAVGNEFAGSSRSPGNYVNVLSVGAMDENDTVADFSSSQVFNRNDDPLVPDLVAPGVNIKSAVPGGGYMVMDGSSMATPHIAGLAAILLQADSTATANDLESAISASCQRSLTMEKERCNRGVPDAQRALNILRGT